MCLIAVAYRAAARYPLIVAANRDESHARPTAPAAWWPDAPDVLGGRDLTAGGTWLAIDRAGRFAAVTNLREPEPSVTATRRSRGLLVTDFLTGALPASAFARAAFQDGARFGPFNMLLLDAASFHYTSNRAAPRALDPGLHVLGNGKPGTEWPKIARARTRLAELLDERDPSEALFAMLAERSAPVDGYDDAQVSLFQLNPAWGTRSSTVLLVDASGRARFRERSFDAAGEPTGEVEVEFAVTPSRHRAAR
ncbi:MAG TPA: NRDE family protein [Gammaproteobacteria bacterium]